MKTKRYLSFLVDNHEGVLTRISSLFRQRGFNIDSLTVSTTNDGSLSRVTIAMTGDDEEITQIINQTRKLYEYEGMFEIDPHDSLIRELLLVKVASNEHIRSKLLELSQIFKARIIDVSEGSMVFELTGKPIKLDAYIENLRPYTILEMCRTGATAMQRGKVKLSK